LSFERLVGSEFCERVSIECISRVEESILPIGSGSGGTLSDAKDRVEDKPKLFPFYNENFRPFEKD